MLTEKRKKWWILLTMTSAISMIFVDVSVLPVALPTIQRNLGISAVALQWLINAYTLSLTVFFLAGGRLADRWGARRTFYLGLLLFSGASALCGLSQGKIMFILARMLQGVGGALLIPSSNMILFDSFPPHQRGKALGIFISIGSVFLALGPFIGGLFSEFVGWRFIFWINLPIALLGGILSYLFVPRISGTFSPFDWVGFFLFTTGICSIVLSLMQVESLGWGSAWTITLFLIGLCLLIFLWRWDRKVEDPYLDFSFFKNRNFLGATVSIFCAQFLLMVTVFWSLYFQNGLSYSPTESGVLSLLSNFPVTIAAPLGGHLLDKRGPRLPIGIGFALMACSLFWFLQNLGIKNEARILSAIIPFGFAVPFVLTPSYTTALGEIPPSRRGLASGMIGMIRQLGATMGLALIGTIFLNVQRAEFAADLAKNVSTQLSSPLSFEGLLSNTPSAVSALKQLPEISQKYVKQIYLNAFFEAFWWINTLAFVLSLIGFLLLFILIKKKIKPQILP